MKRILLTVVSWLLGTALHGGLSLLGSFTINYATKKSPSISAEAIGGLFIPFLIAGLIIGSTRGFSFPRILAPVGALIALAFIIAIGWLNAELAEFSWLAMAAVPLSFCGCVIAQTIRGSAQTLRDFFNPPNQQQERRRPSRVRWWWTAAAIVGPIVLAAVMIDFNPFFEYRARRHEIQDLVPIGSNLDEAAQMLDARGYKFFDNGEDSYRIDVRVLPARRSLTLNLLDALGVYDYSEYVVIEAGLDDKVRRIF
jgi:hypothetical protein